MPGRERVDDSLYRIVIHAHETEDLDDARLSLHTEDGLVPLEDGACQLCDGACTSADDESRDRATSPALRRQVLARDGLGCRGCGSKRGLMVHHIHHRALGGRTRASNLITLCSRCHGLVHADRLVLEGTDATRITFRSAEGEPVDAPLPLPTPDQRLRLTPVPAPAPACAAPTPEPLSFEDAFAGIEGQEQRLARIRATLEGSRARGNLFPHTLFTGPAGTGKTTLARALAACWGARLHEVCGSLVRDTSALLALLGSVRTGDIVFLDEIHGVPREVLERLYQEMSRESQARFTLLAATTEEGELPVALRSRFGLFEHLEFQGRTALAKLIVDRAHEGHAEVTPRAARRLAGCARGTPREALRLVERALDFAAREGRSRVDLASADTTLAALGFDEQGMHPLEQRYLAALRASRDPVSLGRLAVLLGSSPRTLRQCVEPFHAYRGLLRITARGRMAV